jgi:hypothetical protein
MSRSRREARSALQQKRWTRKYATGLVARWVASGESGAAFARKLGVDPQRLFWWRRRVGAAPGCDEGGARPAFVPVVATATAIAVSRPPVSISMVDGTRVDVWEIDASSAAWVASLVDGGRRS